eukprot:1917286-Rhodomonas_salina.1
MRDTKNEILDPRYRVSYTYRPFVVFLLPRLSQSFCTDIGYVPRRISVGRFVLRSGMGLPAGLAAGV